MSKAFGEQNPNQGETAVSWQTWSDGNGLLNSFFYHNTIAGNGTTNPGGVAGIYFENLGAGNSSGNILKNNIFSGDNDLYSDSSWPIRFASQTIMLAQTLNNNLIYRKGSTAIMYDGDSHTWAQYQAHGQDANGASADPVFTTNYTNLHLQVTSPARNLGENLGITSDLDGVSRDATPDSGCYEYV
jgi:hypothetical protein